MKYFIVLSFCEVFHTYGGVYCYEFGVYILFCDGVWISGDVCCVSSVIEYGLFL